MAEASPSVIAISYAKRALIKGTREYERMRLYATVFDQYHVVIFSRKEEGHPSFQQDGPLFLYATNARTRIGMVMGAYFIGRRILKSKKQDSFVVSGQDPLWAGAVAAFLSCAKNANLHVQLHGDFFNKNFFGRSLLAPLKRYFATCLLQRAKKIRVVSERIKKSLLVRGIQDSKIDILPIEADIENFLSVGEKRVYRNSTNPTFLYVGRFSEEKNIPLLLNAFASARAQGIDAGLKLLGGGPMQEVLFQKVKELDLINAVSFIPWTNDVASVMAEADVFCLSSYHEGFAMVLVEAMASGLPVITTDVGCAGDVVKDNLHGYIVPVDSVSKYTEAILQMASNPQQQEKFGREGYQIIKQRQQSNSYLHDLKNSFTI